MVTRGSAGGVTVTDWTGKLSVKECVALARHRADMLTPPHRPARVERPWRDRRETFDAPDDFDNGWT